MGDIWTNFVALLTQALTYLYGVTGSYGFAIIVFTLLVRLVFLPLSLKSAKSMKDMAEQRKRLEPHLEALRKKYGNDRQRFMEEQMKLYKEMGINPMAGLGGCLPMLVQFPLWIGLYGAISGLAQTSDFAAPFLWISNLADKEGFPYILALFTGGSQYVIQRMMSHLQVDPQQKSMNMIMLYMMPAMLVFFAFQVPAGLVLYWATSNVFQFLQQLFTTGWGDLGGKKEAPAVAGKSATPIIAPGGSPNGKAEVDASEVARTERPRDRKKSKVGADGHADGNPLMVTDSAPSSVKGAFRIYTLEPDDDNEADYSADGSSQSMDEAIARAKGQSKVKKKKRKK